MITSNDEIIPPKASDTVHFSVFNQLFKYLQNILLTKITAPQNEAALSYHEVRGQYFLTVVFVATIVSICLVLSFELHCFWNFITMIAIIDF